MEDHLGRRFRGPGTELLLNSAARGDRSALGRVVMDYDPLICGEVRRALSPRLFAAYGEDVQQMVRLAIVRGLPGLRLQNRGALAAWIRTVARRQIIDWAKRRKARRQIPSCRIVPLHGSKSPELSGQAPTPSRILLRKEEKDLLREAIEAVPERFRKVLRLLFQKGPTLDELAASFEGTSREALRKFVDRALDHLELVFRKKALGFGRQGG